MTAIIRRCIDRLRRRTKVVEDRPSQTEKAAVGLGHQQAPIIRTIDERDALMDRNFEVPSPAVYDHARRAWIVFYRGAEGKAILRRRFGHDPEYNRAVEQAGASAQVAEEVYRARTRANLSQASLAERVGTTQSAIARIEDADYEGHSVRTLERVARALGLTIDIRLLEKMAEDDD